MWIRQKIRSEKTLFGFAENFNSNASEGSTITAAEGSHLTAAEGSRLQVIAYRPDYIGPTEEEAHLGQNLLYWFFQPVGAAVRAVQIGQAMIDVTLRGQQFSSDFKNGAKLSTGKIIRHSDAYENR